MELLNKYNRFVVCNNRDFELAKNIVRIINLYISKFNAIKDTDFAKAFFGVVVKYLSKNVGNYKN